MSEADIKELDAETEAMLDDALTEYCKDEDWKETLMPCEQSQLAACEATIKQGLGAFLDVGRALADIRDNRLYKATHKTFERYCKDKWDLGKSHAKRQICGYEAVELLKLKMAPIGAKNTEDLKMAPIGAKNTEDLKMAPIGAKNTEELKKVTIVTKNDDDEKMAPIGAKTKSEFSDPENDLQPEMILPRNEAQARPLSKLTPDQQVDAWSLVLDWVNGGARLTSYLVGKAAKQVLAEAGHERLEKVRKQSEQPSTLVSRLFTKRLQDLMDVIGDEYSNGWRTCSKKEVLRRLSATVRAVDELV